MPDTTPASFQVTVNDFTFTFTQEQIDAADFLPHSATQFHLLKAHRSFNAVLLQSDETFKQQQLLINGDVFAVQIKDELDQMIDQMGYSTDTGRQSKEIKAPMPGLVLQVHVAEGQAVKEGDKLLVLVAMKMENSILANTGGIVKNLAVTPNQAVEKGQLLIELE